LSTDDYVFTYNGQETNTFKVDSSFVRVLSTSKGIKRESMVEPPIDLVDGASGANYLFINDQTRLKNMAALWNTWLDNFGNMSMTLTQVNIDQGINIFCAVGQTLHWIPQTQSSIKRNEGVVDERLEKQRTLSNTTYNNKRVIAISAHDKIYAPVYTQINNTWILPQNKAVAGTNLAAQSVFQRQQIIMGEAFSVSQSSEDDGATLSARHDSYAALMVRGLTQSPSEIETFLLDQAKKGHGGVLSGLVAGWLGKTFGATAGSIAGSIAETLPI